MEVLSGEAEVRETRWGKRESFLRTRFPDPTSSGAPKHELSHFDTLGSLTHFHELSFGRLQRVSCSVGLGQFSRQGWGGGGGRGWEGGQLGDGCNSLVKGIWAVHQQCLLQVCQLYQPFQCSKPAHKRQNCELLIT